MIETNDWILLNSIAYKIHYIEDIDDMRITVMKILGKLIDYDGAAFFLASQDGNSLERPVGVGFNKKDVDKYLNNYSHFDYASGIFSTGKNFVYRESDIISEKERVKTEYYQDIYYLNNWHYSLHLNISFNQRWKSTMQ